MRKRAPRSKLSSRSPTARTISSQTRLAWLASTISLRFTVKVFLIWLKLVFEFSWLKSCIVRKHNINCKIKTLMQLLIQSSNKMICLTKKLVTRKQSIFLKRNYPVSENPNLFFKRDWLLARSADKFLNRFRAKHGENKMAIKRKNFLHRKRWRKF